jgi:hypothetical protein
MENHPRQEALDPERAPFTASLAAACATATDYRQVGSPSLPNYLGATSGSTQGISDDRAPSAHPLGSDNLFRQVRTTGHVVRTYAESMPSRCALQSSGRYLVRHNPATYFVGGGDRAACAQEVVPMGGPSTGALSEDLRIGHLPSLAVLIPDRCNDTHDCPVATGDAWLRSWVSRLLESESYRAGSTLILLVWDEPTPMPFVAIAPAIRPGTVLGSRVDHYALLRLTEDILGLPLLGHAKDAPPLRGALHL